MRASKPSTWRANILLVIVTAIWGFGFVAQRVGMEHIGAFTYNALRFGIGGLALLASIRLVRKFEPAGPPASRKVILGAGLAAGMLLFIAAYLQTAGLATTSAGKAGFITGFYVVLVPVLGLAWKQRTGAGTWVGGALALVGLYLLSVNEALQISTGDLLVLASAFFWAAHIQAIGYLSRRVDTLKIAIGQFAVVTLLSAGAGMLFERNSLEQISAAWGAILFGGLMVVGVSFTLQVIAQREAHPGHAAVIMLSEAMWAVLAGWLLLSEQLTLRSLAGCALMLLGMLISQAAPYVSLRGLRRLRPEPETE